MNTTNLVGNLTADPELRAYESGTPYLTFTLAVNDRIPTQKDGKRVYKERTDFIQINLPGPQAIHCEKYLQKGSKVAITGSIRSFTVENEEKKTTHLVIHADRVEFLNKIRNPDQDTITEITDN